MNQGNIGNCWFIAGVVGIMQSEKLLAKVVPHDQSFSENYTGMFHFRFWLQGGEIVISTILSNFLIKIGF